MQKYEDKKVVRLNFKDKKRYNSNGGGGDDMEERIIKLEADVGSIKEIVKDHNNRFDKIDARFENLEKLINDKFSIINDRFNNLNDRFNNMYESLANRVSYQGLLAMLAGFTAVIGFLIKYFH